MSLPSLVNAHRLAAGLPRKPKDADLMALAEELARHAALKKAPGRSVAKAAEHLVTDDTVRERLRCLAFAHLSSLRPEGPPLALPVAEWVTLDVAAQMFELDPRWMRRVIKHPQYRRMWGWPRCVDGLREWRFRRAVAAGEAVAIEAEEPPHLLPPWCLRAADVDMAQVPGV